MKRNPARLIEMIIWPSFELLLFGMLALSLHHAEPSAISVAVGILSGALYWNFSARVIQEVVAQFLDDAFSRNIQNLFIAPFSLLELSIGLVLSSIIKLMLSFIFLIGILYVLFPIFFAVLASVHVILLVELIFFGSTLSLIALAAIFLFGTRVSFIGWLLSTVLQVFSCVFFERQVLPGILNSISYFVPSSYIFEALRSQTTSSSQPTILGLLALYFVGSVSLVQYAYRQARKNAILTKI